MPVIFSAAALMYMAIYSVESPIRYVFYLVGADWAILLRDALILGPLLALLVGQMIRGYIHPAFLLFGSLLVFHSLVLMGTTGSLFGAALGAKAAINLLFGFFAASLLVSPGKWPFRLLLFIWCVTIVGAVLDKLQVPFPWIGLKTVIGDLTVDVSRDWSIQDPLARRVAGFARSSISVAALTPVLAIILIHQIRNVPIRCAIAAVSLGCVFLTTQKGALVAFLPLAILAAYPSRYHHAAFRLLGLGFLVICIGLPFVTQGMYMPRGDGGVFGSSSFIARILYTWPEALDWISHHELAWFGVGLGGISSAMRVYAPDAFNPADNMFLFLYAYFGVFALLYLLGVVILMFRPIHGSEDRALPALAIIAFAFGYGAVVSIVEDQILSLFLGAAVGVLFIETSRKAPSNQRTDLVALPPPLPAYVTPAAGALQQRA